MVLGSYLCPSKYHAPTTCARWLPLLSRHLSTQPTVTRLVTRTLIHPSSNNNLTLMVQPKYPCFFRPFPGFRTSFHHARYVSSMSAHRASNDSAVPYSILEKLDSTFDIDEILHPRTSVVPSSPAPLNLPSLPSADTHALHHSLQEHDVHKSLETLIACKLASSVKVPIQDEHAVYERIAQLPTHDISLLLAPWIAYAAQQPLTDRNGKLIWKVLSSATAFWDTRQRQQLFTDPTLTNERWKLLLFNKLAVDYAECQHLDVLLSAIPPSDADMAPLPFYNSAAAMCLRQGRHDHVQEIMRLIREQKIHPDAATFNIAIRATLAKKESSSVSEAYEIYDDMIRQHITPTAATYNTLIKYACRWKQWDELTLWMDRLGAMSKFNAVTLRILLKSIASGLSAPPLLSAFERVAAAVPVHETVPFLESSIRALLRGKRSSSALSFLMPLFRNNASLSIYAYNLALRALTQQGDLDGAYHLLQRMVAGKANVPFPNVASFTVLIHAYIRRSSDHDVDLTKIYDLYHQMRSLNIPCNLHLRSVLLFGLVQSEFADIRRTTQLFKALVADSPHPAPTDARHPSKLPQMETQTVMYNMMMDAYFLRYHRMRSHDSIPQEPYLLLQQAVKEGLPLLPSTLNIWVRGLCLFKDLNAAEKMVNWFASKDIRMNERTLWYLVKTAQQMGQRGRAREWIRQFEKSGKVIQGEGLLSLKDHLYGRRVS
ncbi:uncharacterized protein BYT42DRAFT_588496 [Radiomyces spectabilis]|uniref:uncharacterized protein n=1 Tax=Radiomyces spectabilis TaxID=64574 RepID=UPI00222028D8|nr:uncharacterized protein BYT42DRAFT_588496 [Radiomyces spectabilis]KAI8365992.1 hypothetical protein BYT42DRAFT_588496 [Radiomyces spectabilis]